MVLLMTTSQSRDYYQTNDVIYFCNFFEPLGVFPGFKIIIIHKLEEDQLLNTVFEIVCVYVCVLMLGSFGLGYRFHIKY